MEYMGAAELRRRVARLHDLMAEAARKMEFIQAAQYRDELIECQNRLEALGEGEDR